MDKFEYLMKKITQKLEICCFFKDTDPRYINKILDCTENAEHDESPDSLYSILRQLTKKSK